MNTEPWTFLPLASDKLEEPTEQHLRSFPPMPEGATQTMMQQLHNVVSVPHFKAISYNTGLGAHTMIDQQAKRIFAEVAVIPALKIEDVTPERVEASLVDMLAKLADESRSPVLAIGLVHFTRVSGRVVLESLVIERQPISARLWTWQVLQFRNPLGKYVLGQVNFEDNHEGEYRQYFEPAAAN